MLEELLAGVSLPIPHRGALTQWTHSLAVKAKLVYLGYLGQRPSVMVLARKAGAGQEKNLTEGSTGTWSIAPELVNWTWTLGPPKLLPGQAHLPREFFREFSLGPTFSASRATGFEQNAVSSRQKAFSIRCRVRYRILS